MLLWLLLLLLIFVLLLLFNRFSLFSTKITPILSSLFTPSVPFFSVLLQYLRFRFLNLKLCALLALVGFLNSDEMLLLLFNSFKQLRTLHLHFYVKRIGRQLLFALSSQLLIIFISLDLDYFFRFSHYSLEGPPLVHVEKRLVSLVDDVEDVACLLMLVLVWMH